jgi:hypothetical protein
MQPLLQSACQLPDQQHRFHTHSQQIKDLGLCHWKINWSKTFGYFNVAFQMCFKTVSISANVKHKTLEFETPMKHTVQHAPPLIIYSAT